MITRRFLIEIDVPETAGAQETCDYIAEAVRSWSGQFHPEHPLFGITSDDVRVSGLHTNRITSNRKSGD